MEKEAEKVMKTKNGISKTIENLSMQWPENITILDLSERNLVIIEDEVKLPPNLSDLNLSHNNLREVPHVVLSLNKLRKLNLSFNRIVLFDEEPEFCNTIERMDLSNNALIGPPYWVWLQSPKKLYHLNLYGNIFFTNSLENSYLEELLTYTTTLTEIDFCNCYLRSNFVKLLSTLPKAKTITLGNLDYNYLSSNHLIELPCEGLDKLCDIESLNVCNTHIYTINCNISMYEKLIYINLSENSINSLPNEFCHLINLEICILSHNKLLYLPDNIKKLNKLRVLILDSNELCMITENMNELECLKILDLYDNYINEVPETLSRKVSEIDLAQNYFDEPEDVDYVEKKQKLRLNTEPRNDGRKMEMTHLESDHSPDTTDDENFILSCKESIKETQLNESSSENWDSDNDDYWVPHYQNKYIPPKSPYFFHVKQKMEEGNFCPIDFHVLSVADQVLYEMKCNPRIVYECEGQFDDCSSDAS